MVYVANGRGSRMKRIEVMAKMDEQNVADEIITFLREHDLVTKMCSWHDGDRLDAIYGLAQYLGEPAEQEERNDQPGDI